MVKAMDALATFLFKEWRRFDRSHCYDKNGKDKPVRLKNKDGSWKEENGQPVYGPEDDDGTDNITTKYTYDDDDRTLKITYDEKEEERSVKYEYDGLGRIKGKIVRNGGDEMIIDPEEQGEDDDHTVPVEAVIYYGGARRCPRSFLIRGERTWQQANAMK